MKIFTRKNKVTNSAVTPKREEGFTIMETLVAIFILLISTTGPLAFAQGGLRASFLARDQIVAFYLAQDVIETIKNVRDNTALSGGGTGWLSGLKDCVPPSSNAEYKKCTMQTYYQGGILTGNCGTGECDALRYDPVSREYVFDSSKPVSKYKRTIYVSEIVTNREAQIIVEVSWDSNFFSERRIFVQENIYNWIPPYTSGGG